MRALLIIALLLLWPAAATAAPPPSILVLGDSISAGHGVATEEGWVGLLRERLAREGYRYEVVNASVGGDTTSGGLARLPQALERHRPEIVILELGGNDGLRGLPLNAMKANLHEMIRLARDAGARPLLIGIRLPPNYGPAYVDRFSALYRRVAEQADVPLVPRLLEGVGERREWMQPDGIHPNSDGHAQILENVWPTLGRMLEEPATSSLRGPLENHERFARNEAAHQPRREEAHGCAEQRTRMNTNTALEEGNISVRASLTRRCVHEPVESHG